MTYIENCVEKLSCDFPSAPIILAGDLNQLSDADVTVRTGLIQVVRQPTRGSNILDRLFVSYPDNYSTVRVVRAVGKTDHKAIVAHSEPTASLQRKETLQRTFRHKSPSQHAQFLKYLSDYCSDHDADDTHINDLQHEFDKFYDMALNLFNRFYP